MKCRNLMKMKSLVSTTRWQLQASEKPNAAAYLLAVSADICIIVIKSEYLSAYASFGRLIGTKMRQTESLSVGGGGPIGLRRCVLCVEKNTWPETKLR